LSRQALNVWKRLDTDPAAGLNIGALRSEAHIERRALAEWFPPRESYFAFEVFITGSSAGTAIAPPPIAFIVAEFNWRWVCYFAGILAIVWLACGGKLSAQPARHRLIAATEWEHPQGSRVSTPRFCFAGGLGFASNGWIATVGSLGRLRRESEGLWC